MALRESIVIAAAADRVWPFVADPVLQASWNPNIVSIDRDRSGPATLGERFAMLHRLGGRESESQMEVVACETRRRIVFRHHMMWKNSEQIIEEAYDVRPCRDGVRLVQTIDLSRAGIPWLFRAIIWFINRFGWNAEESHLDRLKQLAEQSTPKPSSEEHVQGPV